MSTATNTARPPPARISSSIRRPAASFRPQRTTLAPSAAKRRAIAWPKPFVEPVTIVVLPTNR
jgi:hypothetical protein